MGGLRGYGSGSVYDWGVARFGADGSNDATFGTGGGVTTIVTMTGPHQDSANAVGFQPDGRIVVVGCAKQKFALVRYWH